MTTSKTAPWVAGTALLSLAILAASWMFIVSPKRDAVAESQEQTEAEQSKIDDLELDLQSLKDDFENIQTFRDDLAALQIQVPAGTELAEFIRQLSDIALRTGVTVTSLTVASPTQTTGTASATAAGATVPAAQHVETAAQDAAAGQAGAATTDSAPAAAAVSPTNLYLVQIDIGTLGEYDPTMAFLAALQTGMPRLALLSGITATHKEAEGSSNGRPAVTDGALETQLVVYLMVLPDGTAAPPATGDLPVPSGQPNPFVSLGGPVQPAPTP
jgi:hypothetical protein